MLKCACRGQEEGCERELNVDRLPAAYCGGAYGRDLVVLRVEGGAGIDLTRVDQYMLARFLRSDVEAHRAFLVVEAWRREGVNPAHHRRQKEALRRSWPVLADALDDLARVILDECVGGQFDDVSADPPR